MLSVLVLSFGHPIIIHYYHIKLSERMSDYSEGGFDKGSIFQHKENGHESHHFEDTEHINDSATYL